MTEIKLMLNPIQEGKLEIWEEGIRVGEMVIDVVDNVLTVYHTQIRRSYEGKGLAKQLLDAVVTYARENSLIIRALCHYVRFQFNKHPEQYSDVDKGE